MLYESRCMWENNDSESKCISKNITWSQSFNFKPEEQRASGPLGDTFANRFGWHMTPGRSCEFFLFLVSTLFTTKYCPPKKSEQLKRSASVRRVALRVIRTYYLYQFRIVALLRWPASVRPDMGSTWPDNPQVTPAGNIVGRMQWITGYPLPLTRVGTVIISEF